MLAGDLPPGQPIGPCLATDSLLDEGPWEQLITGLMDEVIAAGRRRATISPPALANINVIARVMGAYRASTLIDFENARPLELEALFRKPLAAARAAGVDTPRWPSSAPCWSSWWPNKKTRSSTSTSPHSPDCNATPFILLTASPVLPRLAWPSGHATEHRVHDRR